MVMDVDATSAAQAAQVYVGGRFKADAVIWPGVINHALVTESLREHDMQIESVEFIDGSLVKSNPTEAQAALAKKQVEENRGAEKADKAAEQPPGSKVSSDSPWAYLTAEERDKDPQLGEVHHRGQGDEKDDPDEAEEKKKKAATQPAHASHPQAPIKPTTGKNQRRLAHFNACAVPGYDDSRGRQNRNCFSDRILRRRFRRHG